MAGNFALSFSLNFLSILVHISGSIWLITLIWASVEKSFPLAEVEYYMMPILVKSDGSGRKAKARHSWLRPAQESVG